jgi:hypothetical protein
MLSLCLILFCEISVEKFGTVRKPIISRLKDEFKSLFKILFVSNDPLEIESA